MDNMRQAISLEQVRGMILGFAVADALGVPVEFEERDFFDRNPVTGMQGGGYWEQPIGTWSDDTSMVLAEMESIARLKAVDYDDIMKNFIRWAYHAEFTATDETFDIGCSIEDALRRYKSGIPLEKCGGTGEHDNGNGSLMRILPFCPICISSHSKERIASSTGDYPWYAEKISHLGEASALTHAHLRSMMACEIYGMIAIALILGEQGKDVYACIEEGIKAAIARRKETREARKTYSRLLSFRRDNLPPREEIKSTGYVVDTLEAAIWCLLSTDNYRDAVLKAVNLGEDTDTVAAIVGGLAGLAYGMESIPEEWLSVLKKRDYIEELCLAYSKAFEGDDAVSFE